MATVLITGGTGMIGRAISKALLDKGYDVIILTRKKPETGFGLRASGITDPGSRIQYAEWDIKKQTIDKDAITRSDYIIHLAGASVAGKRWTAKRKKEIVDSRVKSSELLVKALKENQNKLKAVISASAIGFYGTDSISFGEGKGEVFAETDPPSSDFLGATCKSWEESIHPVNALRKRLVMLRIGIVLSKGGGALKEFLKPLRFGIAAIPGSGNQIISWIHIEDLVNMFIYAMENETMSGVYNAVSPEPVTNKNLVLTLAKSVKGIFFIPVHVPALILKLVLGEMSNEVLKSANVSSKKIEATGFDFQYASIEKAIQQLIHS